MIGVYSITNTANNKIYIGSSVNIAKRFIGHRNALNNGNHENSHLQRAWVKYGIESFSFAVLCEAESGQDVRSLEQQYLDQLTPDTSYNISLGWVVFSKRCTTRIFRYVVACIRS